MRNSLKGLFNTFYTKLILYNNPFYFFGIPKTDYSINDDIVTLKKLGVQVNKNGTDILLRGYPYALKISDSLRGKFSLEKGNVLLSIEDLQFQINSAEELFIIYEVFVTHVYKYFSLHEAVFIDIGMNSGITTLFYARNPLIKKIFAFELFKPTFELGKKNLMLNEKYSGKITANNYGLSSKEFVTTIDYSLSRKGRMGLRGLPEDEHFTDSVKEEVFVRDIATVFEDILNETGSLDVIVKMDCEGEEYNLIDRLSASGLLGKITVLIIEWHYRDPIEIENHLIKFNFHIFSQVLASMDSGMIYAAKR
jgi:FkbM family methyltransferase